MLTHKGTVEIQTERLLLRKFVEKDAESVFNNWANDDEVTKYLTWPTHKDLSITRRVVKDWVASYTSNTCYHWAISLRDSGEVIGSISTGNSSEHDERCGLGYCIGRVHWGKGYTTEALQAVVQFLHSVVGYQRVAAVHYIENPASGRVMEKAGMAFEGVLKRYMKTTEGRFVDCASYASVKKA